MWNNKARLIMSPTGSMYCRDAIADAIQWVSLDSSAVLACQCLFQRVMGYALPF